MLMATSSVHAQQPNILVIMADDLGYADVGFNGCLDIPTPNIDNLATQGVIFSSGYVSHSYCAPTRAGLLTGRYQHRFGFEANPDDSISDVLPANQITIGNVLTNVGYKTILVGKWHLGGNNPNQPPNRGFTDFFGFLGGGSPYFLTTNQPLRRDLSNVVETNYLTHAFTREAVSYINTNAANGNPFILFLSYNAPHQVLAAPQNYLDRFTNIVDSTRQVYAAVVSAMDDGIGDVLQALDDNGIATNTLVIFLSDNGGPTAVTSALNTPLRGFKGNVFEGGVRVPFAARWPGRILPGTVYTNPVISLDIFATATALAGGLMPADRPMDSVNLLPYVLGETNGVPHDYLYWRQNGGELWAVREGNWKWVNNPTNPGPLLVQLADDGTGEFMDLSTNETSRVAAMETAFAAWDAQMLEPLFSDGQLMEINGAEALADNLGYMISNGVQNQLAFALTSPRYPPTTASNFNLRFSMELIDLSGGKRNGFVVLGETNTTNSLIRAGILRDESKLVITEGETGGNSEWALTPDQLPVGTNEYNLTFDRSANSLTLTLGTVSVTRALSRSYGNFDYPGYAMSNASTRFSVIEISHTASEGPSPTYEWDASAGADRNWSSASNWTGNVEPASDHTAYINGGHTGVVQQAGERALYLYIGSTNNPSHDANSTGRVEQTGGDLVIGNTMYLGKYYGGEGRYALSGGTLTVSNSLLIGDQGLGTMVITNAGAATIGDEVIIGAAGAGAPAPGSSLTLGSGSLAIAGVLRVGGENTTVGGADGFLEQFGGTLTVGGITKLGDNDSSTGRAAVAGGVFSMSSDLHVGENYGSIGILSVWGDATTQVAGVSYVSRFTASKGVLSVSGGLFAANGSLEVANAASTTGSVTVAGGRLISSDIVVGRQGLGVFDMSGGAVTASTFALSFAPNGSGSLNMTGGRLVVTNAGENFSLRRRGAVMNVSGGEVVANGVAVGSVTGHNTATEPAIVNLTGGTIAGGINNNSSISNDFYVGSGSGRTGVVNVTGGILDLGRSNNDLIIGRGTNALGIFTMGGGEVLVGGAMRVGALLVADPELTGNGRIHVTNGSLSIAGAMQLPITIGGTAFVSQVGGIVDVGTAVNLGSSGGGGVGHYVISGGMLTNAGPLSIGDASSGSGIFEVSGGSPLISVGTLVMQARGELRSVFHGTDIAPIHVAGGITVGGLLSITNTDAYISGTYLIATSRNGTAVSGTFAETNWMNGVTGIVSYANNRIVITYELAPILVGVPSDATAECDDVPPPASVTATNGCGEFSSVQFIETTNAGFCANSYELIRVWTVTNTCGYLASATQVLSIADTTIPDITCPPNTNVICEAEADPSITGYAFATDQCDEAPMVTYDDSWSPGMITRTWRAVDNCSNVAVCVQTIFLDTSGTDSDFDGVSDYDECLAGTSPSNSQSYLKLMIHPVSPGAALSFTSLVTHAYTIEYQPELTNNATWPVLTNVPGTGEAITINDSSSEDRRHYRLKARREP